MNHIADILNKMQNLILEINTDMKTLAKPPLTSSLTVIREWNLSCGSKIQIEWGCGCKWAGWLGDKEPVLQKASRVRYCVLHRFLVNTLENVFPNNTSYTCPNELCEYPLEEGQEFECEGPTMEKHYEVPPPNVEEFGGWCDCVEECPICGTPINSDDIYQQWYEAQPEAAAEQRYRDRE